MVWNIEVFLDVQRFKLVTCPFPFCILLKQCIQRFGYFREIANKTTVEIGEPKKDLTSVTLWELASLQHLGL